MKAIYINLDPYLAAFAAWIAGGKTGDAPRFDPLPLAVTVPIGQDVGYLSPLHNSEPNTATIDGQTITFSGPETSPVETNVQIPGLSALAPSAYYSVEQIASGKTSQSVEIYISDGDSAEISVTFTVLVRREASSGPVEVVDFAPSITAAQINTALGGTGAAEGQPLKGVSLSNATNAPAPAAADINAALGGTGAVEGAPLAGVSLGRANIVATNEDGATTFTVGGGSDPILIKADSGAVLGAALGAETAS